MTPNNRDLKAYARFDGTGRIVPGSLVLRRTKPKVGNWKEVQAYECCDGGGSPCTLTANVEEFIYPATEIRFQLYGGTCNEGLGEFNYTNVIGDFILEVNNINNLVQILNENFSFYGIFSVTGPTEISLALLSSLSNLCTCTEAGGPFMVINNN
jgi:hypothetical protein